MNSTDYENGDTLWRQVGQGMFGAINLTKQVTRQTKCWVYYISLKGGLTDGFSRQLNRQLKREIKLILNSILAVSRYYSNTISSNQMLRSGVHGSTKISRALFFHIIGRNCRAICLCFKREKALSIWSGDWNNVINALRSGNALHNEKWHSANCRSATDPQLRCINSKTYPLRMSHNGCPERVVPTPQREYHPPINFNYLIHSCHMKFESNSLP